MKPFKFSIVLCFLFLNACGGGGAPMEEEPAMPAPAMPVATPRSDFPETAPTLTPISPASLLPAEGDQPSLSFSPILYRKYADRFFAFQLLGGFRDGVWIKDEDALAQLQYEQWVDVFDVNGWFGNTLIHDVSTLDPPYCGIYLIGSDMMESLGWQFAFYQGWQVTHRPWTDISVDSSTYSQAVADWLIDQGISDPSVQITRVLRVDLEGDGVDEVFISASYFKQPNPFSPLAEFGDYSIVLMRKVSGNSVVTIPIVADVYHFSQPEAVFPLTYQLSGFLDLNQDGNLEVILDVSRWEGTGLIVFEVKDRNIFQALTEVCVE